MTQFTKQSMQESHAVVVGGSMAGMFAARVLADYFGRVTVLDRDQFPTQPDHRKGVPQSHHAHALLARGQQIIEGHFPGLTTHLLARGAAKVHADEFALVSPFGRLAAVDRVEDEAAVFVSRILLEWVVREHLHQMKNVTIYDRVEVIEPLTNLARTELVGLRLGGKGMDEHGLPPELSADFIVDATGRHSKAPKWLNKLGYDSPPEEMINSQIGYASRFYRKPKHFSENWHGIIVQARVPENPRVGLILPIENDMWHVTLGGFGGHTPPTDDAGFMQWAKSLADPSIYNALRMAEPLTPLRGFRTPSNRMRHFEQLTDIPGRFIAIGDSVCAFNPIFGQGMTISAIGSAVLQQTLRKQVANPKGNFEHRFQKALATEVADPWFIATSEDLRWEGVEITGANPGRMAELTRPYINQLLKTARQDKVVANAYFDMINLFRRPTSLMRPNIVGRVLLHWLLEGEPPRAEAPPSRLSTTQA